MRTKNLFKFLSIPLAIGLVWFNLSVNAEEKWLATLDSDVPDFFENESEDEFSDEQETAFSTLERRSNRKDRDDIGRRRPSRKRIRDFEEDGFEGREEGRRGDRGRFEGRDRRGPGKPRFRDREEGRRDDRDRFEGRDRRGKKKDARRKMFRDHFKRFEMLREGLDLSEEQREQIKEVFEQHRDQMKEKMNKMRAARDELRGLTFQDQLDEEAIEEAANEIGTMIAETSIQAAQIRSKARKILTAEQREMLDEMREKNQKSRKKFRDQFRFQE